MAHKKHELGKGFGSMMRDEIVGQPEPVLRDLPEPKEEPFVEQIPTTPEQAFLAKPDIKAPGVVFTCGVPMACIVVTETPRGLVSNSFTIVAHGGNAGAEIRVIGASNVTVG